MPNARSISTSTCFPSRRLDQFSRRQAANEVDIPVQKVHGRQFCRLYPRNLLKREALRLTHKLLDVEENEQNRGTPRVSMLITDHFAANRSMDPKFFSQFAFQRLCRSLPAFPLTARKLPFEWMRICASTLAHQDLAVADDHGGGHFEDHLIHPTIR